MNRRVSYGCSQLQLVGETQADLNITSFFSFFSYYVHVIKLIVCLKKETDYAYGYPYVFLTFYAEEYGKFVQIPPPPCVGGFGHGKGAFGHN